MIAEGLGVITADVVEPREALGVRLVPDQACTASCAGAGQRPGDRGGPRRHHRGCHTAARGHRRARAWSCCSLRLAAGPPTCTCPHNHYENSVCYPGERRMWLMWYTRERSAVCHSILPLERPAIDASSSPAWRSCALLRQQCLRPFSHMVTVHRPFSRPDAHAHGLCIGLMLSRQAVL